MGDEPFYLLTAQSLIADRDLDLRNQYLQVFGSLTSYGVNVVYATGTRSRYWKDTSGSRSASTGFGGFS